VAIVIYVLLDKFAFMKGVTYITDEQNHKKAVVIEMSTLEKYSQDLEDLLDGLIAESRKDDEKVSLENVIEHLKKAGKLK